MAKSAGIERLFGPVLALAVAADLGALWSVEWPPMGDFGGHVELMDVAMRIGSPATAYADVYELRSALRPNALGTALAWLVAPWVDARAAAMLVVSAYLVGLPLALLALCRAFGRSRWLALFACPMAFNAIFNMGLVNYLLGLPLAIAAPALARRAAEEGGRAREAALAALLLLGEDAVTLSALAGGLGAGTTPLVRLVVDVHRWGLQYFRDWTDEVAAVALAVAWVACLALGPADDVPGARGPRAWLRAHALEGLGLGLAAAYLLLPTFINEEYVLPVRLATPALLVAAAWPRVRFARKIEWAPLALLAAVALGYPFSVGAEFRRYEREEVGNLPRALAELPDRTRLAYLRRDPDSAIVHMGPLWHLPNAIHAVRNGGVTDDSFARLAHSAVGYRPGAQPFQLAGAFWAKPALFDYDFVLVRAASAPPGALDSPDLRLRFNEGKWWLFEVQRTDPGGATRTAGAGGGRGGPFRTECPPGTWLAGLAVAEDGRVVTRVEPSCGPAPSAAALEQPPLACPDHAVVVGLQGRSGDMVDALGPVCGPPPGGGGPVAPLPARGGSGGRPFERHCPPGQAATGVFGRAGARLHAIGLLCRAPR